MPSVLVCPRTVNPNVMLSRLLKDDPDVVTEDVMDKIVYLLTLMKVADRYDSFNGCHLNNDFFYESLVPCMNRNQFNKASIPTMTIVAMASQWKHGKSM